MRAGGRLGVTWASPCGWSSPSGCSLRPTRGRRGVAFLIAYRPNFGLYLAIVVVAVGITLAARIRNGGLSVLSSVGATIVAPERACGHARSSAGGPRRHPRARPRSRRDRCRERARGRADARRSVIVVTRGLVDELEPKEVEAVLAHEMAHLAHRDAAVMTASPAAADRRGARGSSTEGAEVDWMLVWPLGLLPLRSRHGTHADCLATGSTRPIAARCCSPAHRSSWMSALRKLAAGATEIPHDDLRSVNAFCIVSTAARGLSASSRTIRLWRGGSSGSSRWRVTSVRSRPDGSHRRPLRPEEAEGAGRRPAVRARRPRRSRSTPAAG